MAKTPPEFPTNLDRNSFGSWVSGFTDGEGYFCLQATKRRPLAASFKIGLRSDDVTVLKLIWAYFQCGSVRVFPKRTYLPNGNPAAVFEVWNTRELAKFVVPHFDQFPLMSKKANDYSVWREAVVIASNGIDRTVEYRKGLRGCLSKWTIAEREHFAYLINHLKEVRKFKIVS